MYDVFYRLGAFWIAFINNIQQSAPLQVMLSWVTGMVFRFVHSGTSAESWEERPPLRDLLLGFFLTTRKSKYQHHTVMERPASDDRPEPWMLETPDPGNDEWRLVERSVELAVAMYTYPTYLFRPSRNWFQSIFGTVFNIFALFWLRVWAHIRTYFIALPVTQEVVGDGILWKKTAAFLAASRTSASDLYASSFLNGVCQTPFALVTDHKNKAIFIAIRGSTSLVDWITDASIYSRVVPELFRDAKMLAALKQIEEEIEKTSGGKTRSKHAEARNKGGEHGADFHGAMFLAAVYIYGMAVRMISPMVDKSPFSAGNEGKNRAANLSRFMRNGFSGKMGSSGAFSEYKIIITGHSLGAGVASLLTLLMRATYGEKVRGYCFSPPGTMVSKNVIPLTKKCVMSFVVGDDVVPRLSYYSLKELQKDIRNDVTEIGAKNSIYTQRWQFTYNGTKNYEQNGRIGKQAANVKNKEQQLFDGNNDEMDGQSRLFAPGHILHFSEEQAKFNGRKTVIKSQWISNESLQQIVFSKQMFNDHKPKRVERIVKGEQHQWWLRLLPFTILRDFIEAAY